MHDPAELLREIGRMWPELKALPGQRRNDLPRELTAEQRDRARQRWEDELVDRLAGAVGRGASPAPVDLDQLQAHIDLTHELCALADRVASRVQQPADPTAAWWQLRVSLRRGIPSRPRIETTPLDPDRWTYTHARGAAGALRWLLDAVHNGVPPLVAEDVTSTCRRVLAALEAAVDGQNSRYAGTCPKDKTRLRVADGDDVITCTTCHRIYRRRDWLRLRDGYEPPTRPARSPLHVNLRKPPKKED